jgi:outer membrane lipoprotein-sorting protein
VLAFSANGALLASGNLKTALAKYQNIERLDVTFEQTKTLKDMDLKIKSSGNLTLVPPGKVEWNVIKPQPLFVTLEPGKITVTADGKTETYKPGQGGTQADRKNLEDLLNWMRLDAEAIERDYFVAQEDPGVFTFQSRREGASLKHLTMWLTKNGDVKKLVFQEASGDKMEIAFGTPKVKTRKKP